MVQMVYRREGRRRKNHPRKSFLNGMGAKLMAEDDDEGVNGGKSKNIEDRNFII